MLSEGEVAGAQLRLPDGAARNTAGLSSYIHITKYILLLSFSTLSDLTKRLAARNQGILRIEKKMRLIVSRVHARLIGHLEYLQFNHQKST